MGWNGPGGAELRFSGERFEFAPEEIAGLVGEYYEEEYGAECKSNGTFANDAGVESAWMTCIVELADGTARLSSYFFSDGDGHMIVAT